MIDPERDPIDALTSSVDALVKEMRRQNGLLTDATEAMRKHRRNTWMALTALAAVFLLSAVAAGVYLADRAADERENCEQRNEIKAGVVSAASIAVEEAAVEIAGDDPRAREEATAVAERVSNRVAQNPGLRLRHCT